ncbi:hypothetical protein DFH06DRAFT_1150429 [Mycena polygramma]|nr:hypothetical protein DFH06DRAFT_1150429 [Mycena polygramma]
MGYDTVQNSKLLTDKIRVNVTGYVHRDKTAVLGQVETLEGRVAAQRIFESVDQRNGLVVGSLAGQSFSLTREPVIQCTSYKTDEVKLMEMFIQALHVKDQLLDNLISGAWSILGGSGTHRGRFMGENASFSLARSKGVSASSVTRVLFTTAGATSGGCPMLGTAKATGRRARAENIMEEKCIIKSAPRALPWRAPAFDWSFPMVHREPVRFKLGNVNGGVEAVFGT